MNKETRTHIKIKNKPACGVHAKRKLKYATDEESATCRNCQRVVKK